MTIQMRLMTDIAQGVAAGFAATFVGDPFPWVINHWNGTVVARDGEFPGGVRVVSPASRDLSTVNRCVRDLSRVVLDNDLTIIAEVLLPEGDGEPEINYYIGLVE